MLLIRLAIKNWLLVTAYSWHTYLDSTHTTKKEEVDPWSDQTGQSMNYAYYAVPDHLDKIKHLQLNCSYLFRQVCL